MRNIVRHQGGQDVGAAPARRQNRPSHTPRSETKGRQSPFESIVDEGLALGFQFLAGEHGSVSLRSVTETEVLMLKQKRKESEERLRALVSPAVLSFPSRFACRDRFALI